MTNWNVHEKINFSVLPFPFLQIIRSLIRFVDFRGDKVSVIVLGYHLDRIFDENSNPIDGSPARGTFRTI